MSRNLCQIVHLDHLVLTVKSIPRSVAFYTQFGMIHQQFTPATEPDRPRHALSFGKTKINLHEHGNEFEPKAANVAVGSGDLCFIIRQPVETVLKRLKKLGVEVLEEGKVVERTGAMGPIKSVYIRDPDENLVELSNHLRPKEETPPKKNAA